MTEMPVPEASMPIAGDGLAVEWLLQAGFLLSNTDQAVAVDPYLSDLCQRVHGLKRARSAPYSAQDLPSSLVLVTHWHEDHFDTDAAKVLVERGVPMAGPPSCRARFVGLGLPGDLFTPLTPGDTLNVGSFAVTATPAVHRVPGYLTEDAIGVVVSSGDIRVFHTGDSEYHRQVADFLADWSLAAALVCVNGTGGNMNALEAAALVAQLNVEIAVPMHFGLWASEEPSAPDELSAEFARVLQGMNPTVGVRQPTIGHPLHLRSSAKRAAHST